MALREPQSERNRHDGDPGAGIAQPSEVLRIARVHDAAEPLCQRRHQRIRQADLVDAPVRIAALPAGLPKQVAGLTTILRRDALLLQSSQHDVDATHVAGPLARLNDDDRRHDHDLTQSRQRGDVQSGTTRVALGGDHPAGVHGHAGDRYGGGSGSGTSASSLRHCLRRRLA